MERKIKIFLLIIDCTMGTEEEEEKTTTTTTNIINYNNNDLFLY